METQTFFCIFVICSRIKILKRPPLRNSNITRRVMSRERYSRMDKAQQNCCTHRDNEEGNLVELLFCKSESCPDCFVEMKMTSNNGSYVFIVLSRMLTLKSSPPQVLLCVGVTITAKKCILSFLYVSSLSNYFLPKCAPITKKRSRVVLIE